MIFISSDKVEAQPATVSVRGLAYDSLHKARCGTPS